MDLEIDIGQVLGAVGGLLFSTRNEANKTKPIEDAPEGKLGLKWFFNEILSYAILCRKLMFDFLVEYIPFTMLLNNFFLYINSAMLHKDH